jgi:hypothetical protein
MNKAMNDAMSLIPVKAVWAFLILFAIVGSLAMGTFAPSMEGLIQIIFAIGLGLVLYFGPKAETTERDLAWFEFGFFSISMSCLLLLVTALFSPSLQTLTSLLITTQGMFILFVLCEIVGRR